MTASVLLICGHIGIEQLTSEGMCPDRDIPLLRRGTGTRGEREWTGHAGPLLAAELQRRGVSDVTVTDARYHADVYGRDYDIALNLHLQRDRLTARAFAAGPAGLAYISDAAARKSDQWLARFVNEYPIYTGIPATQNAVSANMIDNYVWCFLGRETPAQLIECGHADLDAPVIFELGVTRIVNALALITIEYLTADLGLDLATPLPPPPLPVPAEPFPLSTFPVAGVWDKDPAALDFAVRRYSEDRAPAGWAKQLVVIANEAGIRADVAAAQAMHETGRFRFDGIDPVFSAKPEWFNYGGLKTRDGTATAHFATMFLGIRGLIAHMAAYALPAHPTPWCEASDPRHAWVPHTNPPVLATLADYGGGVWNSSPRPQYGSAVAKHLGELRALVAAYVPPATRRDDKAIAADLRTLAAEIERVA
jgi:hypothetical protein